MGQGHFSVFPLYSLDQAAAALTLLWSQNMYMGVANDLFEVAEASPYY